MPKIIIGRSYRFNYPHYGTPDLHPDYTEHSKRTVKVLRALTAPQERDTDSEPSYSVVARDGWRGTACESELTPID